MAEKASPQAINPLGKRIGTGEERVLEQVTAFAHGFFQNDAKNRANDQLPTTALPSSLAALR
jgi:hypothetical protein